MASNERHLFDLTLHLRFNDKDRDSPWCKMHLKSCVVPAIGSTIALHEECTGYLVEGVLVQFDAIHPFGEQVVVELQQQKNVIYESWRSWERIKREVADENGWQFESENPYETEFGRKMGLEGRDPDDHPDAPVVREDYP
ncbi:MAG: hypothetical protein KDE27_28600 [Planctomycetes bacterium]|nr:hypothetical protein [Planctomycetota bacterium]